MKDFVCERCRKKIGQRWANVLFAFGFVFPFSRTQDVVCPCGSATKFIVDRKDETLYKLRVENQS